jgi:hypothetical protein
VGHYRFQADYGGMTVVDDVGQKFSTLDEAKVHAAIVANELGRNHPHPVTVFVVDEHGEIVATEPASETAPARCTWRKTALPDE